jgi:CHAT domain-containing protein
MVLGWSWWRSTPQPADLFAEAEVLRLRYEAGASRQASAKFEEAVVSWTRLGDARNAAIAAQRAGVTYDQLGGLADSLQSYQRALSLVRQSGEHVLESEILSDVGVAATLVSDREEGFEDAEKHCRAALVLAQKVASERAEAKALNCLGEVAYHRQQPGLAAEFYQEAGRLWDKLGDLRGRAQTLLFQGYVQSDLGNFDEARTSYDRAQSLWTIVGDRRGQAITSVAEARMLGREGKYQQALNKFEAVLALLQPMGDAIWEGSSLTGIAQVYLDMGDTSSALKYRERALGIFEAGALKNSSIATLMVLGATYLASGDELAALSRFQRALALADESGIQRWRAEARRYIGVVHLVRRMPDQALPWLERSLEMQRVVGVPRLEARIRADLGDVYTLLSEHAVATRYFDDALAVSRSAGDRVTELRALFGLARASIGLNDVAAARKYVERSLSIAESLRTEVENRELRASYFASVHQLHELYVDVLMRLNKLHPRDGMARVAFEASERARARSLLDSLAEARVDIRTGVDEALLKREQEARRALDEWPQRQTDPRANRDARTLAEDYRNLEERYNQVQAEIRSRSPRYAALSQPQPLSLRAVQQQVLDDDTLLLEYALGDERSYVWVVSNKDYVSYELPARVEIERTARRIHELLTARLRIDRSHDDRRAVGGLSPRDATSPPSNVGQTGVEYWQEAARLSEMLLGPIGKRLAGKRIVVVLDGALQYVPFAALPVPGRNPSVPLIVEHEIVSLPSASVLAVLRRETSKRTSPTNAVAVLADPVFELEDPRLRAATLEDDSPRATSTSTRHSAVVDTIMQTALRDVGFLRDGRLSVPRLPATRREADRIIEAAQGQTALRAIDFDASRATAMASELGRYRIVHFATHAVFNDENPGLSGIILSMFDRRGRAQDGFLRLHDIYSLELPVELVVLSACDTALGRPIEGEGMVGIVRGFMYAGAKRVVASLWKVHDEATGELMTRFYDEMLKKNLTPAAALRQAQLAMWRDDKWGAPFYWAAFVLQGEWN